MTKDGSMAQRGLLRSFLDIARNEGILGLWSGVIPNMQRAYIVNAAELAAYDQAKSSLVSRAGMDPDSAWTHLISALISGAFAAVCCQPVDLVKNRLMNQRKALQQKGQPQEGGVHYAGMIDCIAKVVRNEGILALYKGLSANVLRIGSWCVVMFMTYEQCRLLARRVMKHDTVPRHNV